MIKLKASKKEMREKYDFIVSVPYCSLEQLLNDLWAFAYSSRVEGWACDYYTIDNVLVSTGYAPLEAKNTRKDYEVYKKYNDLAFNLDTSKLDGIGITRAKEDLLRKLIDEIKIPLKY